MDMYNTLAVVPQTNNPEELRKLYHAVQTQRANDAERLRIAIRDREFLKATIAELDAEVADLKEKVGTQDAAQADAVVLRLSRKRGAAKGGLFSKLTGAAMLHFARHFARTERFAEAEALYAAGAVFKPRPFLNKQVGNMLYRQGLYVSALEVLNDVKEHYQGDAEVTFLINASEAALRN